MNLHRYIFYSFLLLFCTLSSVAQNVERSTVKCVVIDAGHGGKDPGATNGKLLEKNITLAVAKKLGSMISSKYPHIKVLYTRSDDSFVELRNRSNFANKQNADLFISIHTNAAKSVAASGTETFIMGADKNGDNLAVAMRENDVIAYEADYSTKYEGFEPGSAESFIIFSLMNYAHQSQSLFMADLVQKEFGKNLPMKNRGVKQAGYLVLWQATMPSILTEIGFLSHPEESKYLASEAGQSAIATQLLKAFDSYASRSNLPEIKIENDKPQKSDPPKNTIKESGNVFFSVLAITSKRKLEVNSSNFGQFVSVVDEKKDGNLYKYYIDRVFSYKEALLLQRKIERLITRTSIVAYADGMEISVDEAKKIKP